MAPVNWPLMRDMETHPKNESEFLAFHRRIGWFLLTWLEDVGLCRTWDHEPMDIDDFLGWFPLPPEPK